MSPAAAMSPPDLVAGTTAVMGPGPQAGRLIHPVQGRAQVTPTINIGSVIFAEPATETPFPIQIGPADSLPKNSFVRIRGLPPAIALSEGHVIGPGAWAVPFISLPTLRISVPVGVTGKSDVTVSLVTVDGSVLTETRASLVIANAAQLASGKTEPEPKNVASIGPATSALPGTGKGTTDIPKSSAPPRSEEQQRALRFVTKGNELLTEGDISTARLYYQRAIDAGLHEGALAMAETYDPSELARLGVRGLSADPEAARRWYERARQLGAPEADARLRRLGSR